MLIMQNSSIQNTIKYPTYKINSSNKFTTETDLIDDGY